MRGDASSLSLVILATVFAITFFVLSQPSSKREVIQEVSQPMPEFIISSLWQTDKSFSNNDFKNHVSLLNVWASWCSACRYEHPLWVSIQKTFPVPIYSIDYKDDPAAARAFLTQQGNPYIKSGLDGNGRVGDLLNIYGTPTTFLLDKHGAIRFQHVGAVSVSVWEKDFLPRIKQLETE